MYPVRHRTVGEGMRKDDEYYMSLARSHARQSKCPRRRVGAVIVKRGRIVSHGYNGVPPEMGACFVDEPCFKVKNSIPSGTQVDTKDCMAIHAEQYAILNAANRRRCGSQSKDRLLGATLYVTAQPCLQCALIIIGGGIKRVVYEDHYPDPLAFKLLQESGIKIESIRGQSISRKSVSGKAIGRRA